MQFSDGEVDHNDDDDAVAGGDTAEQLTTTNKEEETEALHVRLMDQVGDRMDLVEIQALVEQGVDVNLQDIHYGSTLLIKVVETERVDDLKWLIENTTVDVNGGDLYNGDTPLHIACHRGHIPSMEILIHTGEANVNLPNQEGETPLMAACLAGKLEAVQYLVEMGQAIATEMSPIVWEGGWKDVMKSHCGWTALHYACEPGSAENTPGIVRYLVQTAQAPINAQGTDDRETPLNLICLGGMCWDLVEWMVKEAGADCTLANKDGDLPLHRALQQRAPLSVIQCLVEHGNPEALYAKRSFDGNIPLNIAVCRCDTEVVRFLMSQLHKKDDNDEKGNRLAKALEWKDRDGFTPLMEALILKKPKIVECLFVYGGRTPTFSFMTNLIREREKYEPIHYACVHGLVEMAQYLLQKQGTAIFSRCNYSRSRELPIHCASAHGQVLAVEWLLQQKGESVHSTCKHGKTPLHWACSTSTNNNNDVSSTLEIVQVLVEKGGANTNIQDRYGSTPLNQAAFQKSDSFFEVVKWLAKHGNTDVNIPDKEGMTPLMNAVLQNNEAIVHWLLQNAAGNQMLSTRNELGRTARDLAIQSPNKNMAKHFDDFIMKRWNLVQSFVENEWLSNRN